MHTIKQLFDLAGKTALITGGSRGLGLQMAEALGEQGARLVITSRKQTELDEAVAHLKQRGIDVMAVASDLSKESAVAPLTEAAKKQLGHIDILINNAGATWGAPAEDHPLEAWDKVMNLNVRSIFLLSQAVGKRSMIPRRYGRIVNIASIAGKEGNPNASAYSASKAAVIALTKSLGKELADTGICVNCVTPAAVKTAILDQNSAEHIAYMLSKIPMGRFGTPEEIASMVAWLCTEECSFTTGAVFDLSGGRATY